jgi:aspartate racemase
VGITGTRWLVDSDVYPTKLAAQGLAFERPTPQERDAINHVIMEELVPARPSKDGEATFQAMFRRMQNLGCDAVVLGCTEIPLLMSDANSPLPTLDSTRLLARAALRRAVGAGLPQAPTPPRD